MQYHPNGHIISGSDFFLTKDDIIFYKNDILSMAQMKLLLKYRQKTTVITLVKHRILSWSSI